MFDIWRLFFSAGNLLLARAVAKAGSFNCFGCGLYVRQLNVPVRVWDVLCGGLPRGALGLRPSAGRGNSVGFRRNCI